MIPNSSNKENVYGNRQQYAEFCIDHNGKTEIIPLDNTNILSLYYAMAHLFLISLIEDVNSGNARSVAIQQKMNNDLQILCKFAESQRHKLPERNDGLEWQTVPNCRTFTNEQLKTLDKVTSIAYIKYLMQGKLPSSNLESTFYSIKELLKKESDPFPDINLTPEVAQVFDHMLANDADVESKYDVRQPANGFSHQIYSSQSNVYSDIYSSEIRRSTTTKNIGRRFLSAGIVFFIFGLIIQSNFNSIMIFIGIILFLIGIFL